MMRTHTTAGFRAYAVQNASWNEAQALEAYRKRDRRALKKAIEAFNFRIETLQKIVLEMTARADESTYWLQCMNQQGWRYDNYGRLRRRNNLSEAQALTLLAFVITENLP